MVLAPPTTDNGITVSDDVAMGIGCVGTATGEMGTIADVDGFEDVSCNVNSEAGVCEVDVGFCGGSNGED